MSLQVRNLERELAQRAAEDEERLAKAKEEAAAAASAEGGEANEALLAALREEVGVLKHKTIHAMHKSILHRVIQSQSRSAIESLREKNDELLQQLAESEQLVELRERENSELQARVEELEHMIASGAGGGAIALSREASADGEDDWKEDAISTAEAELKAAMAAGDPERLKLAIANASATVAKARARGSQVVKKQQVLGGGDGQRSQATEHLPTVADPLSEEEKLYIHFHELATGRKLALASRGYEVQNIFIDSLYDLATKEQVPHAEWGEFVRLQLPSPRPEEETEEAGGADAADAGAAEGGEAAATIEWTDKSGAVHKVRKALAKMTKLNGWRAKMGNVSRTYRPPADHFGMDEPDEMPAPEGEGIMAPALGSAAVRMQATSSAGGALTLLDMSDVPNSGPSLLSPTGSEKPGQSRSQRYNKVLQSRMEARAAAAKK